MTLKERTIPVPDYFYYSVGQKDSLHVSYVESLFDPEDYKRLTNNGEHYTFFGIFLTKDGTKCYFGDTKRHDLLRSTVKSDIGNCRSIVGQVSPKAEGDIRISHVIFHTSPGTNWEEKQKNISFLFDNIALELLANQVMINIPAGRSRGYPSRRTLLYLPSEKLLTADLSLSR